MFSVTDELEAVGVALFCAVELSVAKLLLLRIDEDNVAAVGDGVVAFFFFLDWMDELPAWSTLAMKFVFEEFLFLEPFLVVLKGLLL